MSLIRSVPVASFVILALIWIGSESLSVFISYLVVLPMIYVNTRAGLWATDPKLLEMARVFRMTAFKKVRYIYVPALMPYLVSGCKTALGMSWKSGIAAVSYTHLDVYKRQILALGALSLRQADSLPDNLTLFINAAAVGRLRAGDNLIRDIVGLLLQLAFPGCLGPVSYTHLKLLLFVPADRNPVAADQAVVAGHPVHMLHVDQIPFSTAEKAISTHGILQLLQRDPGHKLPSRCPVARVVPLALNIVNIRDSQLLQPVLRGD